MPQQKFTWTRVMELLAQLHEWGYQRLRLTAGAAPTGLSWRYAIAPLTMFDANGYRLKSGIRPGAVFGTSCGQYPPFGWAGVQDLGAEGLARKFLEAFPETAAAGLGPDPEYASWFAELVVLCGPTGAVVMFGDYADAEEEGGFYITSGAWSGLPPRARA